MKIKIYKKCPHKMVFCDQNCNFYVVTPENNKYKAVAESGVYISIYSEISISEQLSFLKAERKSLDIFVQHLLICPKKCPISTLEIGWKRMKMMIKNSKSYGRLL